MDVCTAFAKAMGDAVADPAGPTHDEYIFFAEIGIVNHVHPLPGTDSQCSSLEGIVRILGGVFPL
jgi:hypothetical protein